jgi:hypothetical protein
MRVNLRVDKIGVMFFRFFLAHGTINKKFGVIECQNSLHALRALP